MQIEILGSGGAVTAPIPLGRSAVSQGAQQFGIPYARTGPSVFVHGPNCLIDTPEEAKLQIARSRIQRIDAGFYSHWHPDHTLGCRVWETMNGDWLTWPPHHRCTDIYLPQQVAADFKTYLGLWETFQYLQNFGVVNVIELADGDSVTLNDVRITPFRVAEDYVYAFLFDDGATRVLIAPDELHGWEPPALVHGVDLAVIPMGLPQVHPLTGATIIPDEHPVLKSEATFTATLGMVRAMQPGRVVMTHLEEPTRLTYPDYVRLEDKLREDGYPAITFAYDTMLIDV